MTDVVVIGAGAGGIIAAWRAASLGAKTLLLEKTTRIGTKILISGGGKCNITHDGPMEDVLRAFRPAEARFIRPACYRFSNSQIVKMLTDRGLRVFTRPDGRIFPVQQTAKDVVRILHSYLEEVGVEIRMQCPVTAIAIENQKVVGVHCDKRFLACSQVVLATGGSSYPNSGTTGDGWPWAKQSGHTIVPILAALAPIRIQNLTHRAGIALREVTLRARQNGKSVGTWRGDLLFTHQGISGPATLGISRIVSEYRRQGTVQLEVDLAADCGPEQLKETFLSYLREFPKRQISTYLEDFLPKNLIEEFCATLPLDPALAVSQIPQKTRNKLLEYLKGWPLGNAQEVVLDKGEVVAGGIALDEMDPKTMRSLKCEGLYCCGEVLDIAGPVGGYNLQAAFATGFVAGESAARDAIPTLNE